MAADRAAARDRPEPGPTLGIPARAAACAATLAGAVLCAALVFGHAPMVELALNADTLLPFSFAWDLAHVPGAWRGHALARIPSLVPDLAVLGPILLATGSVRWSLLLYGAAQSLAFVLVGGLLAARLGRARTDAATFADGCALVFVPFAGLACLEVATASHSIVLNAFLPVDHFGPFLAAPLGALLAAAQLRRPTARAALGLAACCGLAYVSDLMLLVELVAPLACACAVLLLAGRAAPRRVAGIALAAGAGLLAGWLCLRALRLSGLHFEAAPPLSPALALASACAFAADAPVFVAAHLRGLAAGLAVPLAAFAAFPVAALARARRGGDDAQAWKDLFLWCFAAAAIAGSLAFTAILYADQGSYRYLTPLWAWPVIVLAATLMRLCRRRAAPGILATLAAGVLAAWVGLSPWPPAVLRWDHDVASCLRPLRARLGLHEGLAGYWEARPIEVAAGWSMQVDQLDGEGRAYDWGNDPRWYRHALADPSRAPRYDFIVMRGLEPGRILAAYGPPDQVEPCASTVLWIYRDTASVAAALLARSAGLWR